MDGSRDWSIARSMHIYTITDTERQMACWMGHWIDRVVDKKKWIGRWIERQIGLWIWIHWWIERKEHLRPG